MGYLDDLRKKRDEERQFTSQPSQTQQTQGGSSSNSSYLRNLQEQRNKELDQSRVPTQDQPDRVVDRIDVPEPQQSNQQQQTQQKKQPGILTRVRDRAMNFGGNIVTGAAAQVANGINFAFNFAVRELPEIATKGGQVLGKSLGLKNQRQIDWENRIIDEYQQTFDRMKKSGETKIEIADGINVPFLPNITEKAEPNLKKVQKAVQPKWQGDWEKAPLRDKFGSRFWQTVEVMGSNVASSLLAVLATKKLTGSTLTGTSMLGLSTAEDVAQGAREAGVDRQKADYLGMAVAIPVTILEKFGYDQLLGQGPLKNWGVDFASKILQKKFSEGTANIAARAAVGVAVRGQIEGLTELTQEEVQMIAEQSFRDVGADERVSRDIMSYFGGVLSGLFIGGPNAIMESITGVSEQATSVPKGTGISQGDVDTILSESDLNLGDPDNNGIAKTGQYSGMQVIQDGKINPDIAVGRINDVAQKLEATYPNQGVSDRFRSAVDAQNVTVEQIKSAATEAVNLPEQINVTELVRPNTDQLTELSKLGQNDEYFQTIVQQAQGEGKNKFSVIVGEDSKPIGVLQFDRVGESKGYIANIAIAPEYRNAGAGEQAVKSLFKENPGLRTITGLAPEQSKGFWQKMGAEFSEQGDRGDGETAFELSRSKALAVSDAAVFQNPNVAPLEIPESAQLRDRVNDLQLSYNAAQTPQEQAEIEQELVRAGDQLASFQDSNDQTIIERRLDGESNKLVAAKILRYSDGKYSYSTQVSTETGGRTVPFGLELFNSEGKASQAALDSIAQYIREQRTGQISALEQEQLRQAQQEIDSFSSDRLIVQPFSGTAYRVDTGFRPGGTIRDMINFEADELGNQHVRRSALSAARAANINLANIPATQAVWVTRTPAQARAYGDNVQSIQLPEGSIALTDLGDDGVLVLRRDANDIEQQQREQRERNQEKEESEKAKENKQEPENATARHRVKASDITVNEKRGILEFREVKAKPRGEVQQKLNTTVDERIKELQKICL